LVLSLVHRGREGIRTAGLKLNGIAQKPKRPTVWAFCWLFAQFKFANQFPVLIDIGALQVVQKLAPQAHHFQQAPAGVVILDVVLEVAGETVDSRGQQRHLHFGGSGITLDTLVFRNDVSFLLYGDWHFGFFSDDSKGDILA
jgi:hypothetical protein